MIGAIYIIAYFYLYIVLKQYTHHYYCCILDMRAYLYSRKSSISAIKPWLLAENIRIFIRNHKETVKTS